jgi:Rare lipoprotein B
MSIVKYLQIILLASLLAGCGFRLAGQGNIPDELNNTHVQNVSANKKMVSLVEMNLRANQINVVPADNASALLRLLNEETDRAVISLDNDGKAREFELLLRITFEVKGSENKVILAKQNIKLNRDFVFDVNNLLGANEEEEKLFDEMRRDAARLIINRLKNI